ncbi:hypothetical protein R80B4_00955 [Fibrobacteres bacterium R8-0-B4]
MGVLSEITDYSQAIIDGRIVACRKHRWACLRFLNDLAARGRDGWPWEFDEERAERFFRWMRLFKHTAGELAGKTKEPTLYELFVYGNIYGWIDGKTESRRFRRMYEQLARKQAKSQDKAIQALYEISAFGEPRAEAYIAATKREQTRYVWSEAEKLYKNSIFKDSFECKFDYAIQQKVIKHLKSGSFFARLSKDDGKKGYGSNPHFAVLDEYHLHETADYYDMLTSGMKTRTNPLIAIITTAGCDLSYPCYRVEYDYVSKILNPDIPITDDRYFAMVCELDRNDSDEMITTDDGRQIAPGGIIDELGSDAAIQKSNPVTGCSKYVRESILLETKEAQQKPEMMRATLTQTYNVWVQNRPTGYMDMTRWAACARPKDEVIAAITEKAGGRCYIGVDMSATIDLTSVGFVFPWTEGDDRHYAVLSHSFMPEETFLQKIDTDKVPYDVWHRDGHITKTWGATVDYHAILQYMLQTCEEHGWVCVEYCLDMFGAMSLSTDLQNEGKTVVNIRQGPLTLSDPTRAFRDAVYSHRLIHDANPVLTWAIYNAVTRLDRNANILLDKGRARQRIDPIAAAINAFTRAMIIPPKPKRRVGPKFY